MSAVLFLAAAAAVTPLLAGLVGGRRGRPAVDLAVSVLGVVLGLVVLVAVVVNGVVRSPGDVVVIDRVGAAWSTFGLVMAVTVRTFAARQLAGDTRRATFAVASGAASTAGIALFWAGNLVSLVVAAVLTSLAATWLVTSHRDGAQVRVPMLRALLGADLLLVIAVGVVVVAAGDASFAAAGTVGGPAMHLAAVLVVLAATIRCAQPPFQGWLARSLVAPTPASALLHAGLVNAGGVLLIRNTPLLSASLVATIIGVLVATSGIVVGLAIMRRRHEVKTALVWSTVGQMGFMLVQVLVGLGAAAAAHLIAHGAYKSSLFLASGSTLEHRRAPLVRSGRSRRAVAAGLSIGIVAAATVVSGYDVTAHGGASVLLPAFAVATSFGVLSGAGGLAVGSLRRRLALVGLTGAGVTTYLFLIAWFERWLAVPAPVPAGALVLTLVVIVAVASSWIPTRPASERWLRSDARLDAVARRPALELALAGARAAARPSPRDDTSSPPPSHPVTPSLTVPYVPFGA